MLFEVQLTVMEVKFTAVQVEMIELNGAFAKVAVVAGALQTLELPVTIDNTRE